MTATPTPRTDFATRLYKKLASAQTGRDLFFSPFSVEVALAMCAAGAKGETRRALAELIGAPLDVAEQNRKYAALELVNPHKKGAPPFELAMANALWVQEGERLDPAYRKVVADSYHGALSEVDFRAAPEQAVKSINAWVFGKTAGKIKELIGPHTIGMDTRLILTNAIYFKGKWASQFNKNRTRAADWHGAGGVRPAPMMRQERDYLFYECPDFQAVDLPYQGEQLSMLIVLPTKTDGLASLERHWIAGDTYRQVTGALAQRTILVSLPRFKMETESGLKPALSEMGAALAFSADADFSGIGAQLRISEVIHKAFIEVNEEGTEAAAATGIALAKGAPSTPKHFLADHPFLFVIRDRQSNAVLFCGRVLEPQG